MTEVYKAGPSFKGNIKSYQSADYPFWLAVRDRVTKILIGRRTVIANVTLQADENGLTIIDSYNAMFWNMHVNQDEDKAVTLAWSDK